MKYIITVRTGYNPSRLQENGFQVYTVKKDLHEIGIIAMQTSFGHSVPVYDIERKIRRCTGFDVELYDETFFKTDFFIYVQCIHKKLICNLL